MEIISPGERIKRLRLELGLKQEDITDDIVSKSLISMIEKGRRGLTPDVAKIVANRLNIYYEPMNKKITPEELLETEVDITLKEIKEGLEYIKTLIDTGKLAMKLVMPYFEKLEDLAIAYHLTREMMAITMMKGKVYYHTFQYTDALCCFSDALVYYLQEKDHQEVNRIYNYMGACNHMLMRMDRALNYYLRAYDDTLIHKFDTDRPKLLALSNLILCYRKVKKYDMVLKYIEEFKEIESKDPFYKEVNEKVLLAEANTFRDIRNYERAEKLYKRMIEMDKLNIDVLFLVYENYATLYHEQGRPALGIKSIEKALYLKDKIPPMYVPIGLVIQARCNIMMSQYDEAIKILEEGLKLSQEHSDHEVILEVLFTLVQIYFKQLQDYEKALDHLNWLECFVEEHEVKGRESDLNSFFAEVYYAMGKADLATSYMEKLRRDYFAVKKD